jgi:SAM-dependent methyltransferase
MFEPIHKKKVFLVSSTEALPYLDLIRNSFPTDQYDVRLWCQQFPNGEFILNRLMQITREVDLALIFCAKDAKIERRGSTGFITTGNVLIEYGLFLGWLGKDRVRTIYERGADIPSDLDGLVVDKIDDPSGIKNAMAGILKGWAKIQSFQDQYGVLSSIRHKINELSAMTETITRHSPENPMRETIQLTDDQYIPEYTSTLKLVKNRFWTTSYFSSSFWVHNRPEVTDANLQMLARIKSRNGTKNVKRLFLLTRSFDEEISWLSEELSLHKKYQDGHRRISAMRSEFETLKYNCQILRSKGCQIKYFYDDAAYKSLEGLPCLNGAFKRDDTEIAIYDDFRVDFFDGGKYRKITGIKMCTPLEESFQSIKQVSENYFQMAWDKGGDISALLRKMESVFDLAARKIDYPLNKLLQFDKKSDSEEALLKKSEFNFVDKHLKDTAYYPRIKNYLDIGTCTGRYPFGLQPYLPAECKIYGIDTNSICIAYCDHIKEAKNCPNITYHQSDFLVDGNILPHSLSKVKFELITCMLGTISHFGWNKKWPLTSNDDLQKAILRMKNLLSDNGILFISNWTEKGLRSDMLSIYSQLDRNMLSSFTESTAVLVARLKKAGFRTEVHVIPDHHSLEVIVCKK